MLPNVASASRHGANVLGPDDFAKWDRLAESDPPRIVRALAIHARPDTRSQDGDTYHDAALVYKAVWSAAREHGASWGGLVRAGVVVRLCKNVMEATRTVVTGDFADAQEMVHRVQAGEVCTRASVGEAFAQAHYIVSMADTRTLHHATRRSV
jgi:hypothetical protein